MSDAGSPFYHLHLHTEYSLLDGAIRLDSLFKRCHDYNMDAVAMTDHGTMFGAAHFYELARKKNIKPILGCEVYVAPRTLNDRTQVDRKGLRHLVLLAEDRVGYANLCKMVSIAQLKGFYYKPRIDKELLSTYSKGLIGLSACLKGEIAQHIIQKNMNAADEAARFFIKTFGEDHFFLEIQDNGMEIQNVVNEGILDISQRLSIPVVATNDCHYLSKGDDQAHEILLCIQTGDTLDKKDRFKFDSDQLYFKSPDEMIDSFGQIEGAIDTTRQIVDRCSVEFDDKTYHFPMYDRTGEQSEYDLFKQKAQQGFERKLAKIKAANPDIDEHTYRERLDYEINVILEMGFPGYFLIVADFIAHAKEINVPVGPGRGSAAGSMVAYAMGITALDPIEHGLIFERFLNPSRMSMPDIDVDFCIEGRDQVYKYVVDRYGGADYVCQIITFGKLKAKAVIRDVGRALGVLLSEVDEIAKMIPEGPKVNLKKAIEEVPAIQEKCSESEEKQKMLEIALLLEGLPRHASTHAAGVVVSDKPLNDYLPVYKGKEGETLTQFDMNYVEKLGLVKFDFLGLRNLTVIKNCLNLIAQQGKTPPDLSHLDYEDPKTFELLQKADTTGVFQLESSGMKDLIARLKPAGFSDIVALVALYRPGPLDSGMANSYVERKHGREEVDYLFDELEPVLKETYGVIIYQEQVMKIAGVLANYSMADADGLRKAMGKKIASMMEEHRSLFLKGAKENNHDPEKAEKLFNLMEKFGGYGFNKSHSAAYALIAFQTAYLKANYTLEFIAALMTSERGNSDAVIKYMDECRTHDIKVLPPDINQSDAHFNVADDCILFGLAAIKNVGEAAIEAIIESREKEGRFETIYEFAERVAGGKVNKKTVEALIKSGAFDSTSGNRAQLMAVMEDALEHGSRIMREKNSSQMDLFADTNMGVSIPVSTPVLPDIDEWEEKLLLEYEKESLGFYISGHPLDKYQKILDQFATVNTITLQDTADEKLVRLGGILKIQKLHKTKKGDMMAFTTIEDQAGSVEVVIFPNLYIKTHTLLPDEPSVIIEARVQKEENVTKLIARKIVPIEEAQNEWTQSILISLDDQQHTFETLDALEKALKMYPGELTAFFKIHVNGGDPVIIKLGTSYKVRNESDLFDRITDLVGPDRIEMKCVPLREPARKKKPWQRKHSN